MLVNLRALLGVIVDILLLRRGPDSLPASPVLLVIVLCVYAAVTGFVVSRFAMDDPHWPFELALGTAMLLLWYRVALAIARKRERFVQMMTAVFCVRLIITPAVVPVWATLFEQSKLEPPAPSAPLTLLFLALLVWDFVINVRIVRGTFEWPTGSAILMVIGQGLAFFAISALLFFEPAKPG